MSEKHQMPGYRPSALGLATKVRIGEPNIEMSAYSVVTIICLLEESLAKKHEPVNSFHEKAGECQGCSFIFLFFLSFSLFLLFPNCSPLSQAASVATLPSALLVERWSLGASWVYSIQ